MSEMTNSAATNLRRPFPPESVGQLPKGGVMLDYVGHAAVTDRLLTVDPAWSWEPLALGPDGLPAMDAAGNLWIRLTVCGVSRIGVGDGKNQKERIGDAIRNAAMRFGVALDLWAKENLVEFAQAARSEPAPPPPPDDLEAGLAAQVAAKVAAKAPTDDDKDRRATFALMAEVGIKSAQDQRDFCADTLGHAVPSRADMTPEEWKECADRLRDIKRGGVPWVSAAGQLFGSTAVKAQP